MSLHHGLSFTPHLHVYHPSCHIFWPLLQWSPFLFITVNGSISFQFLLTQSPPSHLSSAAPWLQPWMLRQQISEPWRWVRLQVNYDKSQKRGPNVESRISMTFKDGWDSICTSLYPKISMLKVFHPPVKKAPFQLLLYIVRNDTYWNYILDKGL